MLQKASSMNLHHSAMLATTFAVGQENVIEGPKETFRFIIFTHSTAWGDVETTL